MPAMMTIMMASVTIMANDDNDDNDGYNDGNDNTHDDNDDSDDNGDNDDNNVVLCFCPACRFLCNELAKKSSVETTREALKKKPCSIVSLR